MTSAKMYNSSDSQDLEETFEFHSYANQINKPATSNQEIKVQDILSASGKKGFIEYFVASQALFARRDEYEAFENDKIDSDNSLEKKRSENELLDIKAKKSRRLTGKEVQKPIQKNQNAQDESKVRKKVCQVFRKRLSLFRAKGSLHSVPGLFSTSKQSKIIQIGNHDIIIDPTEESLNEEMDQDQVNTFFHPYKRAEVSCKVQPTNNDHERESLGVLEYTSEVQTQSETPEIEDEVRFPFEVDYYWNHVAGVDQVNVSDFFEPSAIEKVEVEPKSSPRKAFFSPFTLQLY